MNKPVLLPCPFCASSERPAPATYHFNDKVRHIVYCQNCGAAGPISYKSQAEAVELWNKLGGITARWEKASPLKGYWPPMDTDRSTEDIGDELLRKSGFGDYLPGSDDKL